MTDVRKIGHSHTVTNAESPLSFNLLRLFKKLILRRPALTAISPVRQAVSIVVFYGCLSLFLSSAQAAQNFNDSQQRFNNIDWNDAELLEVQASYDRNYMPDGSDLWQELRTEHAIWVDENNPRIRAEQPRYTKSPSYIKLVSKRAEPYLFHVIDTLKKHQLPIELVALPIIESAYNPLAISKHGAAGLWQFIPATGKRFGLAQNHWYDGRHDVLAATKAATSYLSELRDRFNGDWLLAIAAYNAGENNVQRAIDRNRQRNLPTDFWHLKLPKETMAYVPRFLGVVAILRNPERYNVSLHPIKPTPYFSTMVATERTSLRTLATQLNTDQTLLSNLNAGFLQGVTPPAQHTRILIPLHTASENTLSLRSPLPSISALEQLVHHVSQGETLNRISRLYGVSVERLRADNQLMSDGLQIGQTLLIPDS